MARLVFLGTPRDAVPTLQALIDAGHDVRLVVTRPDRRRGRRTAPSPSPVKEAALAAGCPVTDDLGAAATVGAELGVVVAYGRLVPSDLLAVLPMVNVHFSLLPRWRGAAPVERAILAGDATTGVSLMALEAGLDTGPLYAVDRVAIGPEDDAGSLRATLADRGAHLMVHLLANGVPAMPEPTPQLGEPTYADKLTPADVELHWERPAAELARVVRVGPAWTTFRGHRLRVLRASAVPDGAVPTAGAGAGGAGVPGTVLGTAVVTGQGLLHLEEVQPESRRAMDADAWTRGSRLVTGERLGA